MAIVAIFKSPTLTQATYEESIRQLSRDGTSLESPADWPVEGLLVHVAGEGPDGFRVVDVWESEEALERFGEALKPIMEAIGIEGEPEVYPAHTVVTA